MRVRTLTFGSDGSLPSAKAITLAWVYYYFGRGFSGGPSCWGRGGMAISNLALRLCGLVAAVDWNRYGVVSRF